MSLWLFNCLVIFRLLIKQGFKDTFVLLPWFILQIDRFKFFSDSFPCNIQVFQLWIGLPCLLKFNHLLNGEFDLFIGRIAFLSYPVNKLLLLNYGFPVLRVPLKLVQFLVSHTGCSTDENYTWVITIFHINISQNKNICVSADKTLNGQITKLRFRMSCDFVVFWLYQMEDYMRCKSGLSLK